MAMKIIAARMSAITHPATYLDVGLMSSDAVVGCPFLELRLSKSLVGCMGLGVVCLFDETYTGGSVVGILVTPGFFVAVLLACKAGTLVGLTAVASDALPAPLCTCRVEALYVLDVELMNARLVPVTVWVA